MLLSDEARIGEQQTTLFPTRTRGEPEDLNKEGQAQAQGKARPGQGQDRETRKTRPAPEPAVRSCKGRSRPGVRGDWQVLGVVCLLGTSIVP